MSRPRAYTDTPRKVCVLGGGSFGTAMATVLARKGHNGKFYIIFKYFALAKRKYRDNLIFRNIFF